MPDNQFYFIDLSTSTAKPFDGMKAGKFVDMTGHSVEFTTDEMTAYLSGTQAAIEATKAESGDIVGLPIDQKNHDHGDAAGWIVGAELMGDVIRLSAKWTEAGLALIGAGLQRFFSPSVDMSNKAIIGGSLTNWPATRANGKTLLRPIELSQGVYSLETSIDERLNSIVDAFIQAVGVDENGVSDYWVREVFDGYVIVSEMGELYKVTYTEADGTFTFAPKDQWTKVKIAYEDVPATPASEVLAPDSNMSEAIVETPAEPVAVELSEDARIAALVDERVNVRLVELARKADRERDTLAFSERICNGTKDSPIGLSVPPADLCEVLLSLSDEGMTKIKTLLEHVVSVGIVDFAERGHSNIMDTRPQLSDENKVLLTKWIKAGKTVTKFFEINPEIGLMADFNLSEFGDK